ncbi:hypothetical protein [Desulfitobacterium hafniense]|nr:hypothetical protein [Desulfitobacterium hafniense]
MEVFLLVKANKAAAGVDNVSLEQYEKKLKDNLYKLWNRMSSGSYFPKPVKGVEIPQKSGGIKLLGVPTAEDRIEQMEADCILNRSWSECFTKTPMDTGLVVRHRGYPGDQDKMVEVQLGYRVRYSKTVFDNIDHELLMKAVKKAYGLQVVFTLCRKDG